MVDSVRGQHEGYVFVWRRERVVDLGKKPLMSYSPIQTMNNTAWQNARRKADLGDLHVHDLRHTVGMRLRARDVNNETRAVILWHRSKNITTHYSEVQAREIRAALELIKDDIGPQNRSLRSFAKEAHLKRVPSQSLQQEKTA